MEMRACSLRFLQRLCCPSFSACRSHLAGNEDAKSEQQVQATWQKARELRLMLLGSVRPGNLQHEDFGIKTKTSGLNANFLKPLCAKVMRMKQGWKMCYHELREFPKHLLPNYQCDGKPAIRILDMIIVGLQMYLYNSEHASS